MSVSQVSSLLQASFANGNDTTVKPIDIAVSAGEFLKPDDLLKKIVMKALGTNDAAQAEKFIKDSGFKFGNDLPKRLEENGQHLYRFEPSEKFLESIESFKATGKALPLSDEKSAPAAAKTNGQALGSPNVPNRQPARNTPAAPKQTKEKAPVKFAVFEDGKTGGATVSFEVAKTGLDGKKITVPLSYQDLQEIKESSKDGDARLELLTKALQKLGYDDTAIKTVLDRYGITNDGNSGVELPGKTPNEKLDINTWLNETLEAWKESNNINSPNYGKRPAASGMTLSPELRQQANLEDLKAKGDTQGAEQFELRLKIDARLKEIDAEFANKKPENDMQKGALEMAKNEAKKAAIDQLTKEAGLDVRANTTTGDKVGNAVGDGLEAAMRLMVNTNPLYMFLPEEAKKEIVNFGVGIGQGTIQLGGSVVGVQNFFRDAAQDLLIAGMEQSGLDKKLNLNLQGFKGNLEKYRQQERDIWRGLMNANTKEGAQNEFSYQLKKDSGLKTSIWDVPNWSMKAGQMTAKAAPFIALAVATGGASIPVQVGVAAGAGGLQALGENYVQSGDRKASLTAAAWGAAQSAAGPLTAKLPFLGDAAANVALGYGFAKLQNPNADDNEVLQSIMLQTAQGGAFKIGSKLHQSMSQKAGRQLSEAEVKTQFESELKNNLGTVKQEVAIAARDQAVNAVRSSEVETVAANLENQALAKRPAGNQSAEANAKRTQLLTTLDDQAKQLVADWGKNNKVFTKANYDEAGKTLSSRQLYSGIPADKLAALGVKAGYHIEAGARGFKDFARVMKAEVENAGLKWSDARPFMEEIYRKKVGDINAAKPEGERLAIDEKELGKVKEAFKQEALNEAKPLARFNDIQEFRRQKGLPPYAYEKPTGTVAFTEINGEKIFGTNTTLGAEKLGGNNRALRENALKRIQDELGELEGVKYGGREAGFLTHAEAESFIKAADKANGKLPKEMEMFVDRNTCGDCQKGLPLLLKLYNVEKLTIRDSKGHIYEVTQDGTKVIQ